MKEVLDAFSARIKSPIFGYGILAFFGINWNPIFYILLAKVCSRLIDLHTLIRDTLITYRGKYDINKTKKQILYTPI